MISWGNLADRLEQWAASKYAILNDALGDAFNVREEKKNTKWGSLVNWANSDIEDLKEKVVTFDGKDAVKYEGIGQGREIVLKNTRYLPLTRYDLGLPTAESGVLLAFGNEATGIDYAKYQAEFQLNGTTFYARFADRLGNTIERDITSSLPTDYDSAFNQYFVQTLRDRAIFWINGTQVAEIEAPHEFGARSISYIFQTSEPGQDIYIRGWNQQGQGELAGATTTREKYFTDAGDGTDWNAKSISGGDSTNAVDVSLYSKRTVYFYSDTAGTLSVEVQEPDGTWREYDPVSVDADTLKSYNLPESNVQRKVRLSFDTAATVTAWIARRIM